jgi:uncharacterized NAD-dependent epimerase/dehydratase family protein
MRRYLILAPGAFLLEDAKTAHGLIRYAEDETVAVVDPSLAGRSVKDVMPHLRRDAPFVASVEEGLQHGPTSLVIGTAPMGGRLPAHWRAEILVAIRAGLEIVSGLHEFLSEDDDLARTAAQSGSKIVDVRRVPPLALFSGTAYRISAPVLLTVGNNCAVGKMTVSLEITAAARRRGRNAEFVPTGQTGIMVAGWGLAVDRVISDFASGAVEQLVVQAAKRNPDLIVVEGQGAINHPAYASVTLALLFGAAPDALLLVCDPRLKAIDPYGTPALQYRDLIRMHEALCAMVKPARVVGIALNTTGLSAADAAYEIERAAGETGLPADDVVRFGPLGLYDAIAPGLQKQSRR